MVTEFYKNLSRKRMGVGVVFLNNQNEFLIVKPNYKDYWTLVGGVVDEDESPRQAAVRECKEEIGLDISNPKFLCVEYSSAHDDTNESLQFLFYGGNLLGEQIAQIKLQTAELDEYQFSQLDKAKNLMHISSINRLSRSLEALKKGNSIYLENGE